MKKQPIKKAKKVLAKRTAAKTFADLKIKVAFILSLRPCKFKREEFRLAIGDKSEVSLLEIAEASGPHGLWWVLNMSALGRMIPGFYRFYNELSIDQTVVRPLSSDPAHALPPDEVFSREIKRRWMAGRAKGMSHIRQLVDKKLDKDTDDQWRRCQSARRN